MPSPAPMIGPSIASIMPVGPAEPTKGPVLPLKPRPAFGVFLSPIGFTLARVGIYALYAVCAIYFSLAGLVYYVLPETYLVALFSHYSLSLDPRYFRGISTVHFIFAALHATILLFAFMGVISRLYRRRFPSNLKTISLPQRTASLLASIKRPKAFDSKLASLSGMVKPTRVGRGLVYVYARVMAQASLFDVESRDFEMFFLVRELVETLLQSYQAYTMNRLLPRQQLNRFYVTLLVINCWSSPVLHYFSGRNAALKRLLSLVWDFLLDFVSVVGVSAWLASDYLANYDPVSHTLNSLLFFNDIYLVRLLNDVPQILLASWLEAVSRLVFSLSMLSTIDDIKKLLKRKPAASRASAVSKAAPNPRVVQSESTPQRDRLMRWAHRLMILLGFLILGIHCHAEFKSDPPSCALQIRPWLVPQPACALIEINCITNPDLSGKQTEFDAIFENLDTQSLLQIVVRHCPHLEFTSRLQTFPNLLGLKTYNTTVGTWQNDAAFTRGYHLNLRNLYFIRTNFPNATLPEGLLVSELSPNFKSLTICSTNINWMPDTLHEHWRANFTLYIEYAELTEFPVGLLTLNPNELSLSYNHIQQLPSEVFQLMGIVSFTGNPITTLPADMNVSSLVTDYMLVDRSLITTPLPLWIDEAFVNRTMLFLGGSPFCETVALNESTSEYQELLATRPWLVDGRVDCTIFDLFFYPLGVDVRETDGVLTS